ncbi:MAG: hypothetical protein ABFD66_15635, partial [Smithella sp.]
MKTKGITGYKRLLLAVCMIAILFIIVSLPGTARAASGTWTTVGSAGFSTGVAANPSMALDSSGAPYVAYIDSSNSLKATVMKYNSVTSQWETVGSAFSAAKSSYTSIVLDSSGTPYVAYQDGGNSNKATVMKYNSVTSKWETVGTAGFSAGRASYPSIALDSSGTPYVAYMDG